MGDRAKTIGRRDFVKTTTAATAGLMFVSPATAFGTQANSAVRLGLVGCGGRGTNVAENFVEHTNTQVVALSDVFQDRLDQAKKRFDGMQRQMNRSAVDKTFQGPNSYQQLAASDLDVVLIASPPYYHPEHLEAALDAGRHVYLEKPVATDVRGCRKVASLAQKAQGRVSVDVGFQIRRGRHFAELTRRIHAGDLGTIACAQGYYFAGDLPRRSAAGVSANEARLRNWVFDRVLGGDILVEQNIHIIDVFNWVLNNHPVKATGTGGRKVRTDVGDVWDHYVVTYHYPENIQVGFMSTQFLPTWGEVCYRFFGSKGFSEAFYTGGLRIRGENAWEAGAETVAPGTRPEVDPLADATPEKVKAFISSIQTGNFHNELQQGAESTLSAVLGREAAYQGKEIQWSELLASDQHWDAGLDLSRLS
jgi:myo-inositol 2-dehydrogenase / D-chiro-inositol 1-dehydrogenase